MKTSPGIQKYVSSKIRYNFSLTGLAKIKFYFPGGLKNVWLDMVYLI